MIIKNNGLNSMPQQVQENMENIKLLASYLKEAYNTALTLSDSAVSIAISDTNATADTTDGWLLDSVGSLFKINGGDGTNLLIEYYTSFRGPQGPEGTTAIDDDVKSLLKTWSSQKISDKIDVISDKGIYYTLVQPTLVDDTYELNTSDLANPNQYTWQKINDIIVYIDGNGKVKEIYNCVAVQGDFSKIYLQKVGEIGGKKYYQHNIQVNGKDYSSNSMLVRLTIINDTNDSIDTFTKLAKWLDDNGYSDTAPFINGKWLLCSGINSYNNHYFMGVLTRPAKDVLIVNSVSGDEYIASDIVVKDNNIVEL